MGKVDTSDLMMIITWAIDILKQISVKDVPMNNYELLNLQACSFNVVWNRGCTQSHDDVIKWKHFPRYWPFVRGIHPAQSPVRQSFDVFFDLRPNIWLSKQSPHVQSFDVFFDLHGDLKSHPAHYDVIVMSSAKLQIMISSPNIQ